MSIKNGAKCHCITSEVVFAICTSSRAIRYSTMLNCLYSTLNIKGVFKNSPSASSGEKFCSSIYFFTCCKFPYKQREEKQHLETDDATVNMTSCNVTVIPLWRHYVMDSDLPTGHRLVFCLSCYTLFK
jgi:hypothetical protein